MSLSPTISPSFSTRSRSFFLSLIFCSQNLHGLSFSNSSPLITATATATTTATTTNNNLNPQPPKKKKKKNMAQTTAKTHDKTATKPTTLTTPIWTWTSTLIWTSTPIWTHHKTAAETHPNLSDDHHP